MNSRKRTKYEEQSVLEKFNVVCKKCGSDAIEKEDSRGYSETSGAWGSLDFVCANCGERESIVEN